MKRLSYLFLFSLFFACANDDVKNDLVPDLNLVAEELFDIPYGDNPMQKYDLYLPAKRSEKATKTIIIVHGGAWTQGDKADMAPFVEGIKNLGKNYAIVNTNYILADVNNKVYPNQLEDLGLLITNLKSKSAEYQLLPEFGFLGTSAGAHLSLLYSYAFDINKEVKMVCGIVGPADFTDPAYLENPLYALGFRFLADNFDPRNTSLLEKISPSYQVNSAAPPTLLFYGDKDPLIPNSQHKSLKKALEASGVEHELTVYSGGHGDWDEKSNADLIEQFKNYLDTYLPVEEIK